MLTRSKKIASTIGAIAIVAASVTWACGPGSLKGDMMHGHKLFLMAELLELNEEQRDEIKAIRASYGFDKKKMRKEFHKEKHNGLMSLDPSADDYNAQVETLIEQRTIKMAERMRTRAKMHSEIYTVLTDEQREKLTELKAKMQDRRSIN